MEPRFKANRFTLVLIYAVLEWTLIFLLLLNSLFSYLIIKFALYFKLKPPCLLCSRIDHILEPYNSQLSYKNLICEHHSIELSKSGYCFTHRKLVESHDLCLDCSSSPPQDSLRCSCCGSEKTLPTHVVVGPCLDVLGDTQMGNLVSRDGFGFVGNSDQGFLFSQVEGDEDVVLEAKREAQLEGCNGAICAYENDIVLPQHLEFYIDNDDYGLIPVEFFSLDQEKGGQLWRETDDELVFEPDGIDVEQNFSVDVMRLYEPKTQDLLYKEGQERVKIEVDGVVRLDEIKIEDLPNTVNGLEEELNREVDGTMKSDADVEGRLAEEIKEEVDADVEVDGVKVEKFPTIQGQGEETKREVCLEADGDKAPDDQATEEREVNELDVKIPSRDCEDLSHNERDVFGIENGNIHVEEPSSSFHEEGPTTTTSVICEASTDTFVLLESCHFGSKKTEEEGEISKENERNEVCHKERDESGIECGKAHVEEPSVSYNEETTSVICEASTDTFGLLESDHCESKKAKTEEEGESRKENELVEVEEDRAPDTPTSLDSFQLLHRKLLILGRSKMAKEESVDGSVVDDLEYGGGEVAIEELKSELRAERKASRALYEELEEERSAAAIAASHTMAMINRLQEDKAMIEMEALQYQRMMEEQAEYDQEALQLMNEILVKREREKEELERELEESRKLLMYSEEREIIINHGKDITSSAFSSNKEESDDIKENGHHDTSAEAVLSLKDSLSSFEEERLSILEQLKVLEENLCTLAEEEDHQIRNMKTFEELYQENAEELSRGFKLNGDANGEHHQERTTNGSRGGVIGSDNESSDEDGGRLDPFLLDGLPLTRFESEKRRFTIEEEVERLYERLQALETDKEFIKHCFATLRKGDRGIYLLQEILQHLRDLKNAEFRAREF